MRLPMMSRRTATSIVVGSAVGAITFVAESVLVAMLPPLGGVSTWFPFAVLLLITLGMGIACGLVVHVFTRLPRLCVFVSAVCSRILMDVSIAVWLRINAPAGLPGSWLAMSAAITLANVVAFSAGAAVGFIVLRDYALRASEP